jgi:hypothetical protein
MRKLLMLAFCLSQAARAEEPPKHLLRDTGVRVVLPAGWTATEWTPEQLQADRADGSAKLYAWATPGQAEITSADLPAWGRVYQGMLGNMKAGSSASTDTRASNTKEIGGRTTARVDLNFEESGRKGVIAGASVPVAGRVFHVAVVGLADRAAAHVSALEEIVGSLDIKEPASPRPKGELVSGGGMSVALPAGWYPPLPAEDADLRRRVEKLGVVQLEGCWVAVHPVAGGHPDALAGCPANVSLGVVDEDSFGGVDAVLRERLFGTAPVDPAARLPASDRTGFRYSLAMADASLQVGVLPTASGIERIWALGDKGRAAELEAALTAVAAAAKFEGPHPAGPGDWIGYYLAYHPTSPAVIAPGILMLASIVLGIRVLARPRTSPVDDIA